jgi:DNA polymerase-3 subunit delta
MNAEKQIVLLKEAQTMKDIERLETYITKPSDKTIFVVSYKEKKLDGKTKFAKKVKDNAVVLTTKKLYENQVGEWITNIVKSFNVSITPKASVLLVHQIGNDLSRLKNEIEKIVVNLDSKRNISEDEIEKFIGISKEYNVFELQDALAQKNLIKAIRISQYFAANPKAAPIQMILPGLYGFFSKVYMVFGAGSNDERTVTSAIGVAPFQVRNYIQAANNYGLRGIESVLLLLHEYNLRSIGVNDSVTSDANLLKEMIVRIIG